MTIYVKENCGVSGVGKAGTAASDGTYEQGLVSALVQPSGMKVVVPADAPEVVNFLRSAATMSADTIGLCLLSFLLCEVKLFKYYVIRKYYCSISCS